MYFGPTALARLAVISLAAVVFPLIAVLLPVASAQTDFDRPFDRPQYLIHITGHGTLSGPVTDNQFILYIESPDATGVFREADGFGGTVTYSSDRHYGPLTTPRAVCAAAASAGLPQQEWTPYNRTDTFDCRLLTTATSPTRSATAPRQSEAIPPRAQQPPPPPDLGQPATPPAAQSNSHRNLWIPIGIGVILVIVIGAGAAWYFLAEETPVIAATAAAPALPAAVPAGLTWGSLIGDLAEAERLLAATYDITQLNQLSTLQYQLAWALRALRSGAQLTPAMYELLRRAGYLP
ncbi:MULTISPECIES: hypothetical protein [unclassified Nocardia]|uniref:hypothetical protein n=1 Tax=unclassified Nocardia TaxID=2637762 RepID=UPI001CE49DCC|nr:MULTISPECIES: hypothetical protein [unclassified Nocardia]